MTAATEPAADVLALHLQPDDFRVLEPLLEVVDARAVNCREPIDTHGYAAFGR